MEAEGWMDKCVRTCVHGWRRESASLPSNLSDIHTHTHNRPNVHVEKGRWQDGVARLIAAGKKFDAIFFDTYAEHYRDMQVGFVDGDCKYMD